MEQLSNTEKINIQKRKVNRKTTLLLILSIVTIPVFILNLFSTVTGFAEVVKNFFSICDKYPSSVSLILLYELISVFIISASVVICFILSIIIKRKISTENYRGTISMLNAAMIILVVTVLPGLIISLIMIAYFILWCLMTFMIIVDDLIAIFEPFFRLTLAALPGAIFAIIYFIISADVKGCVRNIVFYKELK